MNQPHSHDPQPEPTSVGKIIGEVSTSAKNLLRSELNLARAEFKDSLGYLKKQLPRAAIYSGIFLASILPFIAFLVIGIGKLLNENYWLSSLIIAVLFAAIGGFLALKALNQIKQRSLTLPHTRDSFHHGAESISEKAQEVKSTASEKVQDIREATKWRNK